MREISKLNIELKEEPSHCEPTDRYLSDITNKMRTLFA